MAPLDSPVLPSAGATDLEPGEAADPLLAEMEAVLAEVDDRIARLPPPAVSAAQAAQLQRAALAALLERHRRP